MHREHKQHFFCYSQTIREWIFDKQKQWLP